MLADIPPLADLTLRLLYRDGLMLVIDKPAGYAVHPGPGKFPNLQAAYGSLKFGLPRDPALAHRLDRETSGCLILGRHNKALQKLGLLFKQNKIEKTYLAIAAGCPPQNEGTVDAPLWQHKTGGAFGYKMVVNEKGDAAVTHYKILEKSEKFCLLELKPQTGRTHQLRAHMAHIGCPLRGDTRYGGPADDMGIFLHAQRVVVPLYKNKPAVDVTAPLPAHFVQVMSEMGWMIKES